MTTYKLKDLAYARSGDKGDIVDIGVMANRILEMADLILVMADNIGLQADQILLTGRNGRAVGHGFRSAPKRLIR